MRLVLWGTLAALAGVCGCTAASSNRPDTGPTPDMGTGTTDVGADTSSVACTNDGQCVDAFECTIDQCVAGNVCMHTPIDAACNTAAGEHCSITMGCTTMSMQSCRMASECDDGNYCTDDGCSFEQCYHQDHNCDDGNPCTIDTCDSVAGGCAHETTCDSGIVVQPDAGPACTTFTPPADFNGTYTILPSQAQACGSTTYTVSQVTLSVSGTTVTAVTGPTGAITMSGTIDGSSFDVSGSSGMGSYHLTGTFACRERFMGHWTANVTGFSCSNQDADVRGSRR